MATLLSANHTPAAGVPAACGSPCARHAAVQRPPAPAAQPSDFVRELCNILAALTHR